MNAKLTNQVEIAFWDFFIYTLSESRFVRGFVRFAFRHTNKWKFARMLSALLLTASVGLFSGMLLYILAFHFN